MDRTTRPGKSQSGKLLLVASRFHLRPFRTCRLTFWRFAADAPMWPARLRWQTLIMNFEGPQMAKPRDSECRCGGLPTRCLLSTDPTQSDDQSSESPARACPEAGRPAARHRQQAARRRASAHTRTGSTHRRIAPGARIGRRVMIRLDHRPGVRARRPRPSTPGQEPASNSSWGQFMQGAGGAHWRPAPIA